MPQVTQDVLNVLRNNEPLQFAIAQGMNRKFRTIERWVRDNDEMLGSTAVVLIIAKETGLSEDEILEAEKVTA